MLSSFLSIVNSSQKWAYLLSYLLYSGTTTVSWRSKNYGLCWKIIKKEKLQHKYGILAQTNSWVTKIKQNIYHYEILRWLTCQFQASVLLLNPLKIYKKFSRFSSGIEVKNWPRMNFEKSFCLEKLFHFD